MLVTDCEKKKMTWLNLLFRGRNSHGRSRRSYSHIEASTTTKDYLMDLAALNDKVERLEHQLMELEQDRDAQKGMKLAFKTQATRLGEALRICQEAALDQCKKPSPSTTTTTTTGSSGTEQEECTSDQRLLSLQSQAKQNGWSIHNSEVELQEELGNGASAITYKAVWHGLDVAVKCIQPHMFGEKMEGVAGFCQEIELLSRQRHPYVLQLLAASLDPPENAWIVTEYFPLTLMEWLHGHKKRQAKRLKPLLPLLTRLRVALDVALGMQYLHELNPRILHRDLKPSNIFMDQSCHVRVADFGFGRYLNQTEKSLTGEIGTYIYMAPEVIRHEPYDGTCDVYSFGVILCELVTGDPPYIHIPSGPVQIAVAVAYENLRPTLPNAEDWHSEQLAELIQAAWHQSPSKRPSFAEMARQIRSLISNLSSDRNLGQKS